MTDSGWIFRRVASRLPRLRARPASFEAYARADDYRGEVERSFNFMPVKHHVFVQVKVDELLQNVSRHLGSPSELSFLDVGCGVGSMMESVAPHVKRIAGIDINAEAIEDGRRRVPSAELTVYDGTRIPFDGETFDVTYAINVMHHVPKAGWPHFASEMLRVTRRGGLVFVFEHNPYNPLTQLAVFRCAFDDDAVLLSRRHVSRLLTRAGGRVVERRYILFVPVLHAAARALERHLTGVPAGAQHMVVAVRI